MWGKRMTIEKGLLEDVIVCAVRYACGRRTYAVLEVVAAATALVPDMSDHTLRVLSKDLRGVKDYGDPNIDKPQWMRLLGKIDAEITKRGI